MDNLASFTSMRQLDQPNWQPQAVETDTGLDQLNRTKALLMESANQKIASLKPKLELNVDPLADRQAVGQPRQLLAGQTSTDNQGTILGTQAAVTQTFGARGPWEKFSGGVNYGTDFAVPKGTKVALPQGSWKVVESFNRATASGPNNAQAGANRGYGNSVLVVNTQTGEKLRFSHLSDVFVQIGEMLNAGTVLGLSGATGNVAGRTGEHLDLEYYDARGRLADVLQSQYADQLF